ncbi:hypothetical protein [Ramlibacter alkalitolerans]|uniref:Uncharacterized protein n=1 Tax=Ramlibacter alkalitolerans TaxID=2039631 RepID=A0ABS1JU77_9BURK|nr:hypothetical protein [Ramlibacter alkalitolerans]MBL0427803.1 hypothetical protein [Ramlibacter alkalitolerans]
MTKSPLARLASPWLLAEYTIMNALMVATYLTIVAATGHEVDVVSFLVASVGWWLGGLRDYDEIEGWLERMVKGPARVSRRP